MTVVMIPPADPFFDITWECLSEARAQRIQTGWLAEVSAYFGTYRRSPHAGRCELTEMIAPLNRYAATSYPPFHVRMKGLDLSLGGRYLHWIHLLQIEVKRPGSVVEATVRPSSVLHYW